MLRRGHAPVEHPDLMIVADGGSRPRRNAQGEIPQNTEGRPEAFREFYTVDWGQKTDEQALRTGELIVPQENSIRSEMRALLAALEVALEEGQPGDQVVIGSDCKYALQMTLVDDPKEVTKPALRPLYRKILALQRQLRRRDIKVEPVWLKREKVHARLGH